MAAKKSSKSKTPAKKKLVIDPDPTITLSYSAPKSFHDKLNRIGHDNRSKGLRKVVDKYKGKIPDAE